ncbi:MAG: Fic family protein [Actinomycetota bacterium]|nr:Fic family protein [Actinomycetota bacterium]
MAYFVKEYWVSEGDGITRNDRRGCAYDAYVPDPLTGRTFTLDGEVAADVADAEAAILRLNAAASSLANTEAIARLLLRAEAVASSRIEGLQVGARRLLRVEAAREFEGRSRMDVTAEEVLGNIDAMAAALASAESEDRITVETILGIHERLLANTDLARFAGQVRDVQNWIGGSAYNPCAAAYVPPPPSEVPALLADLAEFCNDDSLPAVAQAAVAHAQFETIHPFVDGNGRTGRALIHLILRRRGLAPRVVAPVSLVLATLAVDYMSALTTYRYDGEPTSADALRGLNRWIALFSGCCTRSVRDAGVFGQRVLAIQAEWRERLGAVRRGSSADILMDELPGMPILTVNGAARLLDRSFRATNLGIEMLVDAGVLRQVNVGRRNRAFEAIEIIEAFTAFERQLASPSGDTRTDPPTRPVPARRTKGDS